MQNPDEAIAVGHQIESQRSLPPIPVNPIPEHYHGAYFPAGGLNGNKRPNISAIRHMGRSNKGRSR